MRHTNEEDSPLGPFQIIWDAWTPAEEVHRNQVSDYFINIIRDQFVEYWICALCLNTGKADNEIMDIISVSMNWLRSRGYTDKDVATLAKSRSKRYEGHTDEIIKKYGLPRVERR